MAKAKQKGKQKDPLRVVRGKLGRALRELAAHKSEREHLLKEWQAFKVEYLKRADQLAAEKARVAELEERLAFEKKAVRHWADLANLQVEQMQDLNAMRLAHEASRLAKVAAVKEMQHWKDRAETAEAENVKHRIERVAFGGVDLGSRLDRTVVSILRKTEVVEYSGLRLFASWAGGRVRACGPAPVLTPRYLLPIERYKIS